MADERPFSSISIVDDPTFAAFFPDGGGARIVTGHYPDGETVTLFSYYPDEITFTETELTGLTLTQVRDLHHQRDMEYLRS